MHSFGPRYVGFCCARAPRTASRHAIAATTVRLIALFMGAAIYQKHASDASGRTDDVPPRQDRRAANATEHDARRRAVPFVPSGGAGEVELLGGTGRAGGIVGLVLKDEHVAHAEVGRRVALLLEPDVLTVREGPGLRHATAAIVPDDPGFGDCQVTVGRLEL